MTRGLNQLRDRMHEAQSAMNHEPDGGQDLEAALGRMEQLRQRLEEMKSAGQQRGAKGQRGSQGQKGEAPGQQGSQGQKGAAPGQQSAQGQKGEGPGQQGSEGQQPGGSAQGSNGAPRSGGRGGGSSPNVASGRGGQFDPRAPLGRGFDPTTAGRNIREGIRDLGQLEQMLRGNREIPREVTRDVQDLIREMRQVDSGKLSGVTPERLDQIVSSLVDGTEQIELQLRRLA